ncbi:ricin-type beta-trefoil lectin domain protein [Streptomyces cyaneofuscatus]|uniref:RICIN domain-containing protein n=1 Tax=Streptomyces cyaneofuscatus TaxID=66883 RepID=UPI0036552742
MSSVLRKLLVPALLALTSFALPSPVAAAPAAGMVPAAGAMCLNSNYPTTRIVNVSSCNYGSSQRWTISGEAIYQSAHPGMCLTSDYPRTRIVNVEPCNSSTRQRWTVSGEAIYQSAHPGMCLTSDYPRTRIVNVEPCNPSGIRQHWTVLGEQISMTLV